MCPERTKNNWRARRTSKSSRNMLKMNDFPQVSVREGRNGGQVRSTLTKGYASRPVATSFMPQSSIALLEHDFEFFERSRPSAQLVDQSAAVDRSAIDLDHFTRKDSEVLDDEGRYHTVRMTWGDCLRGQEAK